MLPKIDGNKVGHITNEYIGYRVVGSYILLNGIFWYWNVLCLIVYENIYLRWGMPSIGLHNEASTYTID